MLSRLGLCALEEVLVSAKSTTPRSSILTCGRSIIYKVAGYGLVDHAEVAELLRALRLEHPAVAVFGEDVIIFRICHLKALCLARFFMLLLYFFNFLVDHGHQPVFH